MDSTGAFSKPRRTLAPVVRHPRRRSGLLVPAEETEACVEGDGAGDFNNDCNDWRMRWKNMSIGGK